MSDTTTESILDAARSSILDFGVRRTTLTDIARRAGVSRMTVYRRYPDVDAVLRDLMTREFGSAMLTVATHAAGSPGRGRLVAHFVEAVGALRGHPLMAKVMEAEPELLLPYVLGRMGETQRAAVSIIEHDVADGQRDGSVRAGDPAVIAQAVLLVAQSFVLSGGIAEEVPEAALREELGRMLDAGLAP